MDSILIHYLSIILYPVLKQIETVYKHNLIKYKHIYNSISVDRFILKTKVHNTGIVSGYSHISGSL